MPKETDSKARNISDPSQLEGRLSGPERVRKTQRKDYLAKSIHGDFTKVVPAQEKYSNITEVCVCEAP